MEGGERVRKVVVCEVLREDKNVIDIATCDGIFVLEVVYSGLLN